MFNFQHRPDEQGPLAVRAADPGRVRQDVQRLGLVLLLPHRRRHQLAPATDGKEVGCSTIWMGFREAASDVALVAGALTMTMDPSIVPG